MAMRCPMAMAETKAAQAHLRMLIAPAPWIPAAGVGVEVRWDGQKGSEGGTRSSPSASRFLCHSSGDNRDCNKGLADPEWSGQPGPKLVCGRDGPFITCAHHLLEKETGTQRQRTSAIAFKVFAS